MSISVNIDNYKQIKRYPNYWVNDKGDVISVYINHLAGSKSMDGYRKYHLRNQLGDNKSHDEFAHRLVAETYLDNPNNYPCVNHKDGDKLNNDVNNLEWCTYSHNSFHSVHTLGNRPPVNCCIPIKVTDVIDNKEYVFKSISECGRYFGVSYSSIILHLNGKYANPSFNATKLYGLKFEYINNTEDATTIESASK